MSYLRVNALLVGGLLGLLPPVGGRVVAERGQLGLGVEEVLGAVDGLLTVADGRDEGALGAAEVDLVGILGLIG